MPNEEYQFPAVLRSVAAAKRRHAGEADSVLDDPEQFAVGKLSGFRQAQVRRLRVQTLAVRRIAAAVVAVTRCAMIGEVRHRFLQSLIGRGDAIVLVASIRWSRQPRGQHDQEKNQGPALHVARCMVADTS